MTFLKNAEDSRKTVNPTPNPSVNITGTFTERNGKQKCWL